MRKPTNEILFEILIVIALGSLLIGLFNSRNLKRDGNQETDYPYWQDAWFIIQNGSSF